MYSTLRKLPTRFPLTGWRGITRSSLEENQYVASVQSDGLPTNFFQKRLPRLPIADLEKSCKNLLESSRVFLTPREFDQSQKALTAFVNGAGKRLQQRLVKMDEALRQSGNAKSYMRESFDTKEATSSRASILTTNEVAPFHADTFGESDRLVNLSNLVVSFLRFMKSIDDNVLEPSFIISGVDFVEMMDTLGREESNKAIEIAKQYGALPACPNRLFEIFRGARLPREGKDERRLVGKTAGIRHIVVFYRGRIWKVQVLDESGRVCSPLHVWHAISYIRQQAESTRAEAEQIALCTAVHRDLWAYLRSSLRETEANRHAFRDIDEALFGVALEDEKFNDLSSEALSLYIGEYGNRYLDKDFKIIANGNGRFATYSDKLWATGLPVLRMMQEVADDIRQSASSPSRYISDDVVRDVKSAQPAAGTVQELHFTFNNNHLRLYERARAEYDSIRRSCDVHVGTFPFDANFAQQYTLSADFLVQQAVQTAFHSLFAGRMPVQTETCSVGSFLDGRTEAMLTTSPRTKRLAEIINGGSPDDIYYPEVYTPLLVLAGSAEHRNRIQLTRSGETPLSHLFALRYEAQRAGGPFGDSRSTVEDELAFLKCPAIKRLDKVDIDTAQVTKRGVVFMPIGGRLKEGSIRVTYAMQDDCIQYTIVLMRNEVPISASQFSTQVSNAAVRLRQLVELGQLTESEARLLRLS